MCAAAVVAQVIVALPVSEVVLSVIVPGAVKFWSGAPKLQVGISVALGGVMVTGAVSVTVPANPFTPDTVMTQVPDPPGDEIVIVEELQPGVALMPAVPTAMATPWLEQGEAPAQEVA
jgi:hypothetical protein